MTSDVGASVPATKMRTHTWHADLADRYAHRAFLEGLMEALRFFQIVNNPRLKPPQSSITKRYPPHRLSCRIELPTVKIAAL